jgi:ADP-ribose pyrophosphatase
LKEETGFVGVVVDVSPVVYSDPGLSNANMQFVHINVDANCLDPKQALEDGEFVDVMKMPYDNLLHHLLDHAQASGCVIDARLYHYAVGLHLSSVDAAARSTTRAALPFFLLGAATALGVLFAARALLK